MDTVTATPVGTPVDLTCCATERNENFKVVVGDLAQIFPDRFGAGTEPETAKQEATSVSFGISIMDLTAQRRETLGLKQPGGVLVSEVETNSFAEDIGLHPNDILMEINQKPVNSTADVKTVQATLKPGEAVAFRVMRKGRDGYSATFLAGTLPNSKR